jgi:flagellar basal-body rod protein FlgB
MNILATAEKHMSWLAARQMVASANLANADTPGFKARDISPFGKEMQLSATHLLKTNAAHIQPGSSAASGYDSQLQNNDEMSLSGNDVVMEKEMRTIGDNARLYTFDIGLMKSFQRMLLSSVKG